MNNNLPTNVLWLILDAVSFPLVKRLLQEDKLPHLKSLYRQGIGGPLTVEPYNCQTPAALTALFTGKPSAHQSIGGFFTPVTDKNQTLLEMRNSFLESDINGFLIWDWAARNGKTVSLAHIPFSKYIRANKSQYWFVVDGYSNRACRGELFLVSQFHRSKASEGTIRYGGYSLCFKIFTCTRAKGTRERVTITHKSGNPANTVDITVGEISHWKKHTLILEENISTAVYALYTEDKSDVVLLFTGIYRLTSAVDSDLEIFFKNTGAFQGECFGRFYREGRFGPTLAQGGTGYAEKIFLAMLDEMNAYFARVYDFYLRDSLPNLTVFYLPTIDEMGHEFTGFVDQNCRCHHPHDHWKYRQLIESVYGCVDNLLGKILENVPGETSIIVTSDHGMDSCSHVLYLNQILAQQKLLEFKPDGTVDLSKTAAFYHPAENGAIFINTDNFKGGIVPQTLKEKVKARVKSLLEKYIDDSTGSTIAHCIIDINTINLKNKQIYGDLFFIPQPLYSVKASPGCTVSSSTNKSGCHHFNRGSEEMKGIFFIRSPYISPKTCFIEISNHEIFLLICRVLHIPVPGDLQVSSRIDPLFQ
jgi:predicted AlkP superfamily phosphohydrolase/phosphomutase